MKKSRRNIPDAFSPQKVVHPTDIPQDRIQEHLEDKTPIEDIYGENDSIKKEKQPKKHEPDTPERNSGLDVNTEG